VSTEHGARGVAAGLTALRAGDRIAHYCLKHRLGRGGMGEVFLAWDEHLERHVAIKGIRSDRSFGARQRARFRREARALARLSHPAIVQIFDLVDAADCDYIVMEHVEGTRLDRLLAESGRGLELGLALELAAEIADGLGQAHAKGIVHRDLKPENVIVTPSRHAKILDFGLARMRALEPHDAASEPRDSSLTESGMLVGTAHAMSPEQARGQPLDHRSDLFALGNVIYAMLTGRPAFRGRGFADTMHLVVSQDPVPVRELRPEVPEELGALVAALLAKDPDDRPRGGLVVVRRLELAARARGSPGAHEEVVAGASPRRDLAALSTASSLHALAPGPGAASVPVLRMIVAIDLAAPVHRADHDAVRRVVQVARDLAIRCHGLEMEPVAGCCAALFERTTDAVGFALAVHDALAPAVGGPDRDVATARIAVHLGEVVVTGAAPPQPGHGSRLLAVAGGAVADAARVLAMALPGQTLVTRGVFDLARRWAVPGQLDVRWLAHGAYALRDVERPVELFEVGRHGVAPLAEPPDCEHGRYVVAAGDELARGWRPAAGQVIPRRPSWILRERLGRGSSGEVWLATDPAGEQRVFKFCFDGGRLRALKREATLVRLLVDALGERRDIARILDWSFTAPPYFVESEYTDAGDLVDWSDGFGGIAELPVASRLALAAEVADALSAAHSVGILHKDVKPQNVLIARDPDGRPYARLADFGIAMLLDRAALTGADIPAPGFTDSEAGAEPAAGTRRYLAPELLDGKPATIQADIYALGVMLYQMVAGDLSRALAPGWERDIADELLAQDIAAMVDRAPERRPASAAEVAERLRTLEVRRSQRAAARRESQAVAEAVLALAHAQRRRRAAIAVGALASIMLVLVSGFAYQVSAARAREQRARTEADRRRLQAEGLIQFMLVDLRRALEPIGKLALLDAVGDEAQAYFAAVPERELSALELESRATALHQIGEVRVALGKLAEASEAFRESLALATSLAARDPANRDRQFGLGQSHFWLGSLLWRQKQLPAALDQFRAYLGVAQDLVAHDPRNRKWLLELAYAHSNLGSVSRDLGNFKAARGALVAAAGIMETLAAEAGDDELRLELAHVQAKLGDILAKLGDLVGARTWFQRNLDALQALVARAPDDMPRLRFLGYGRSHLGNLLRAQGDVDGALAHYREDLGIAERLATHDPDDRTLAAELALRKNQVADLLVLRGDPGAAQALLDGERAIVDALLARDPEHPPWRLARVRGDLSFAVVQVARGAPAAAIPRARAATATLQELVERSPGDQAIAIWRPYAWWLLGRLHDRVAMPAEARAAWQQGLSYVQALARASDEPRIRDLHARLALALGRSDEARGVLEALDRIGYREPELTAVRRELDQRAPAAP
jgi:serine/threonine protein kinase